MTVGKNRIEWTDSRKHPDGSREIFRVCAEKVNGEAWVFSERSFMDLAVMYYLIPATPELMARAEREMQVRLVTCGIG